MKKIIIIISVIILSSQLLAIDIYLGGGYNEFNLEDINNISSNDEDSGISYLLGARMDLSENVKIGLELESIEAEWSDLNYNAATFGALATIEYIIVSGDSFYGDNMSSSISVFAGIGVYNSGIYYDNSAQGDEATESTLGYKFALQYNLSFSDFTGVQTRIGYRDSQVEVDSIDLDFSGLTGDLALTISF